MNYKVEKLDKSQVKFTIELGKEEWQKNLDDAANKNKNKFNIVGFRKGKAPRKVIESTYGESVFYEDALSDGFYKYYFDILAKEPSIKPVENPNLNILDISQEGLKVEAVATVEPEVSIKKYVGFNVKLDQRKVTQEEIDLEMKKLIEQNVRLVEVNKPAELTNIVNIDFIGKVNDVPFEGGESKGYDLELGSKSFIDTFEEQLVGLSAGEEKDITVTFPENYHAESLKGAKAVFSVKVNSVKSKEYPELNDELISNVTEFETLEEYKKDLLVKLEEQALKQAQIHQEDNILEKVLENLEVEVPEVMVEHELDHYLQDLEGRLMYQGLTLAQYAEYLGTTLESLRTDKKAEAEKSVKVRLALQHIMNKEGLNITDEEIEAKIVSFAERAKMPVKEYRNYIDDHSMGHITNDLMMEKILKFLVDNN